MQQPEETRYETLLADLKRLTGRGALPATCKLLIWAFGLLQPRRPVTNTRVLSTRSIRKRAAPCAPRRHRSRSKKRRHARTERPPSAAAVLPSAQQDWIVEQTGHPQNRSQLLSSLSSSSFQSVFRHCLRLSAVFGVCLSFRFTFRVRFYVYNITCT